MRTVASAIALVALTTLHVQVEAWPKFLSAVPNGGDVEFNRVDLGHKEGNLMPNEFGRAFNVDRSWAKALCEADSDGDGQTNGQELGDPCCVWTVGANATRTTGLSNPGNKSSTADPSLWKDVDCSAIIIEAATAASQPAAPPTSASSTVVMVVGVSMVAGAVALFN